MTMIKSYIHSFLAGFIVLLLSGNVLAQSTTAIGQWQSHLPYFESKVVTQSEEKVFYATRESVIVYDKEDGSVDFLTRLEGLSQTGIQNILYDEANAQLIIAYNNFVLDFVSEDGVVTITDIRDKADIQGDKLVYDMYIREGSTLYLATGFGLVEFDLINLEFGFTMDISQKINKVDGDGSNLIIAFSDPKADQVGTYILDINSTNAPGFFPEWREATQGLPADYLARDVYMADGKTYVALADEIYISDNADDFNLLYAHDFEGFETVFLDPTPDGIMLGLRNSNKGKIVFFDKENNPGNVVEECVRNIRDAVVDESGRIYFCDVWKDIAYIESVDGPCVPININSPYDRDARDMSIVDGKVYVASGGVRENFGDAYGRVGFYILEEGEWTNINYLTNDLIQDEDVIQVFKVAASPKGDKAYFASFWAGLVEYNTETKTVDALYNTENSALQYQIGDSRVRLSGLAYDQDNTLWISNFGAEEPLVALSEEGEWYTFKIDRSDVTFLADIEVDDAGIVWVAVGGSSGGLLIYDKGADLMDKSDDEQRFLNQTNSEIPSNFVNTVKVDRSGSIWVGTGSGVVVFECGNAATDETCIGNKRKVQEDNITAFLLESEDVLAIGVDGADRKWFGTRNGIFVQSPDGEEKIANYNVENSPLFDNTIRSLAFDPESGMMYIGTDMGMQSIRTETTGSRNRHEEEVFAFPNPVRPEYRGPIAIKGLARDAEVRITDIDGHLVHKSNALGGQAIWDGQDLEGKDVASGVYLVFSSSVDLFSDIDAHVTKILVVR